MAAARKAASAPVIPKPGQTVTTQTQKADLAVKRKSAVNTDRNSTTGRNNGGPGRWDRRVSSANN